MPTTTDGQIPEGEEPFDGRERGPNGLAGRVFHGRAVIQSLIAYVEAGQVPAGLTLPTNEVPRVIGVRQLVVETRNIEGMNLGDIVLEIESVHRSRNPVLPFVHEANVESRVLSELSVRRGDGFVESA